MLTRRPSGSPSREFIHMHVHMLTYTHKHTRTHTEMLAHRVQRPVQGTPRPSFFSNDVFSNDVSPAPPPPHTHTHTHTDTHVHIHKYARTQNRTLASAWGVRNPVSPSRDLRQGHHRSPYLDQNPYCPKDLLKVCDGSDKEVSCSMDVFVCAFLLNHVFV